MIGAGGFSREVLDVIEAIQHSARDSRLDVIGLLADPEPSDRLFEVYGVSYLGGLSKLSELPPEVGYLIAIGSSEARQRIGTESSRRWSPSLVHPSAVIGRAVSLGPGTIVCANVTISNHITTGDHCVINMNCTIGHDVKLGNWVTLSPGVSISGHCDVGDGVFFGTGAVVRDGCSIGDNAVVGMGSAVVSDVKADTTVVGIPARPTPRSVT